MLHNKSIDTTPSNARNASSPMKWKTGIREELFFSHPMQVLSHAGSISMPDHALQ